MSQIWQADKVVPVTLIKFDESQKEILNQFQEGDLIKVSGVSKGKGFQGVVKRHGFGGGPQTHGQKNRLRAPGSIGATAPQRVIKGRKMAGHMGAVNVTVKNLSIAEVNMEDNVLLVRGAVPGRSGSYVQIMK